MAGNQRGNRRVRDIIGRIKEDYDRLLQLEKENPELKDKPNSYRSNILSQNHTKKRITSLKEELSSKINSEILDITYIIYLDEKSAVDHARLVNLNEEEVKDLFQLLSSLSGRKIDILEIKRSKTYISKSQL
jgi:hypothetical protein